MINFKLLSLLWLYFFAILSIDGIQAQSLVGKWIWNKNTSGLSGNYYVYFNDTYIFFDDNTGSWESRGFKNDDLFVVRRSQFTWKRAKNIIVFYNKEATRYDVASGNLEMDNKNMYTTTHQPFRFEGANVLLFTFEGKNIARYVRIF